MKKQQAQKSLILLLTAGIWGFAFVAQSVGMDYVQPFTFNAVRCLLGAVSLMPVIFFMHKKRGAAGEPFLPKTLLAGGLLCGVCLFVAGNLQQIGIQYTTVGKGGFITACYIVYVPVLGIVIKKRPPLLIWGAVALTVIGLYLLCITENVGVNKGDLYMLLCSVCFAVHVMVIDHFSPKVDGVKMSCIQFIVCGVLSGIVMLLFETPQAPLILQAWPPILYSGVMSCGVAYTLQIIGQKNLDPTVASLILSLESCIAVLAGWLLLGQGMSAREITGCFVMFGAIVLAQLPGARSARLKS